MSERLQCLLRFFPSDRPIHRSQPRHAAKVALIPRHHGPAAFQGYGGDAQVHHPDVQALGPQFLEPENGRLGKREHPEPSPCRQQAIYQHLISIGRLLAIPGATQGSLPSLHLLVDRQRGDTVGTGWLSDLAP